MNLFGEKEAVEKTDLSRLRGLLLDMTGRCPASVLAGSYQRAVSWKKAALEARKAAESKRPSAKAMQDAYTALLPYYSEHTMGGAA